MITEATLQDVPQLCELLAELFEQESDFKPDQSKQVAGLRLVIEHSEVGRIFIMRRGGSIAGMINMLSIVSTRKGGVALLLEDMIVRPEYRGQGVASALLAHAIAFARSQGAVEITLLTDANNQRAISLYQKLGFVNSGEKPMRLHTNDPIQITSEIQNEYKIL